MDDDIVTRLRDKHGEFRVIVGVNQAVTIDTIYGEAADEIERWRDLAIHAWVHMGMDATCSDDDCEQCQTIKKAWENK